MSVRVLFTDLDGTLLNDAKEVTPGNQAAIDEALAKGHKIVVCTQGRLQVPGPAQRKQDLSRKAVM